MRCPGGQSRASPNNFGAGWFWARTELPLTAEIDARSQAIPASLLGLGKNCSHMLSRTAANSGSTRPLGAAPTNTAWIMTGNLPVEVAGEVRPQSRMKDA